MIIKFWLIWILFIALMFLLAWIGVLIAKKTDKLLAGGFTIGFLVGLGLALFFILGASRLYILHGGEDYSHYVVYGDGDYTLENGAIIHFEDRYGRSNVINDSQDRYGCEEIVYAIFSMSNNYYILEPGELESIDASSIDYFFDNEPPDEIPVADRSERVSRYWLYQLD